MEKGKVNWTEEIARESSRILKDHASKGGSYRSDCIKLEDARYGTQYSSGEKQQLLALRQSPLVINITTAISETAEANLVNLQPEINVAPIIDPYDESKTMQSRQIAGLYSAALKNDWHNRYANVAFDKVITDVNNVGFGIFDIIPEYKQGIFGVTYARTPWRYYFPDPNSRCPMFTDADNHIISSALTYHAAYKMFREFSPEISFDEFKEEFCKGAEKEFYSFVEDVKYGLPSGKDKVRYIKRKTLEFNKVYILKPKAKNIDSSVIRPEYKTSDMLTPAIKKAIANGEVEADEKEDYYLTEYITFGSKGFKKVFPITKHNLVAFTHNHRDNPYPTGRVYDIYHIQRALNKFVMSAILNASTLNGVKVLAEEGSISNQKKFMQDASTIGAILTYKLLMPGKSQPPQIIDGKPMNDAWLNFPRFLMQMAEYVTGITSMMQGQSQGAPDALGVLTSLQTASTARLKRRMLSVTQALSLSAEIGAEFYKNYAPLNGYSVDYMGKSQDEVTKYNQTDIQFDKDNNPRLGIKEGTDLSQGFSMVRFSAESTSGVESLHAANILSNLTATTGEKTLIPHILERLNLPGFDKIRESIDVNGQLMNENSGLKDALTNMERRTEIMNNHTAQLIEELARTRAKGKYDSKVASMITELESMMKQPTQE